MTTTKKAATGRWQGWTALGVAVATALGTALSQGLSDTLKRDEVAPAVNACAARVEGLQARVEALDELDAVRRAIFDERLVRLERMARGGPPLTAYVDAGSLDETVDEMAKAEPPPLPEAGLPRVETAK